MKKYVKLMDFVHKLYQYQLINCDEGYEAVRARVSDPLLIEEFGIGLAGSNNELHYEVAHMPTELAMLEELELIKYSDKMENYYDTFKERITFPIQDEFGNAVGIGGWALYYHKQQALRDAAPLNKKDSIFVPSKYINSATSKLFDKSDVVFNLYHAMAAIKEMGFVYLAEGYFDVTSIHSSCRMDGKFRENVVSSMGTGLTRGQASILKTYTDKVLVCYDGDSAGLDASLKAIYILEQAGLMVRIASLPDGHDPDSYFKEYGNLDVLDESQLNVNQFRFLRWWDDLLPYVKDSHQSLLIKIILKEFPALMAGASRTTICPLIAVMAIDLGVSEVNLTLDLCIIDPNLFGVPYMFNVLAHDEPEDYEQYLKEAFNQTDEYLSTVIHSTSRTRKEVIAYGTMLKLWQSQNS